MNHTTLSTITLALIASLGLSACNNTQPLQHSPANSSSVTTDHKQSNAHDDSHEATWGYTGNMGPEYWGDVHGNETCSIGKQQSPINITRVLISTDAAPSISFGVSDIEISHNGHTIVYTPKSGNNTTLINGETFTLLQFHYHAPSEHQFAGVNYPAEVHFVHANAAGELAVIGVMLNPTSATNALGNLTQISKIVTQTDEPALVTGVDLTTLLPIHSSFYNYAGSLTTPPCSEQVQWFVADKPLAVSSTELAMLSQLYTGNNRPIQRQGDRQVIRLDSK